MQKPLSCYRSGAVNLVFLNESRFYIKISPADYLVIYEDQNQHYLDIIQRNKKFKLIQVHALLTFTLAVSKIAKFLITEYFQNERKVNNYILSISRRTTIIDSDQFLEEYQSFVDT